MLESVNKLYFKQSSYDSLEEMFEAMYVQQLALIRNSNMCIMYQSLVDDNIFVLEFASTDPAFNKEKLLPCWVTTQEAYAIAESRVDYYQDSLKDIVGESMKLDEFNDDKDDNSGGSNPDA